MTDRPDEPLCPYRTLSVALLDQEVSGTVVDVLEPIRPQQNAPVPASDYDHHILNIQNLKKQEEKAKEYQMFFIFRGYKNTHTHYLLNNP